MIDISNFISQFVGDMFNLVTYCFSLLDSITFGGFSLLDYTIALFLIALTVPLIVVVVPGRAVGEIRRAERKLRDD